MSTPCVGSSIISTETGRALFSQRPTISFCCVPPDSCRPRRCERAVGNDVSAAASANNCRSPRQRRKPEYRQARDSLAAECCRSRRVRRTTPVAAGRPAPGRCPPQLRRGRLTRIDYAAVHQHAAAGRPAGSEYRFQQFGPPRPQGAEQPDDFASTDLQGRSGRSAFR